MSVTQLQRDEPADYMLVPLTPIEAVHAMFALQELMAEAPDAIAASAWAWLRDSNGEFLNQHPSVVAHLREQIRLMGLNLE